MSLRATNRCVLGGATDTRPCAAVLEVTLKPYRLPAIDGYGTMVQSSGRLRANYSTGRLVDRRPFNYVRLSADYLAKVKDGDGGK